MSIFKRALGPWKCAFVQYSNVVNDFPPLSAADLTVGEKIESPLSPTDWNLRSPKTHGTGFRTIPNTYEDNLPSFSLPPSLSSRLMLLYLQPSPRIIGVETTSRHFVCADRPSETGGDNRGKERLRQPTAAAPGTTAGRKGSEILSVLSSERRHHRKDKTSVEGNRVGDKYICAWEGNTPKNPRKGVFCGAETERRGGRGLYIIKTRKNLRKKGKTSTWKIIMCPSRRKQRVRIDNYINKLLPGRRERWKERRV